MNKGMFKTWMVCLTLMFSITNAAAHYDATVVRVIDGDTVVVRINFTKQLSLTTSIRLNGVDTPEKRGKCQKEKVLALKAHKLVHLLLPVGSHVTISTIRSKTDIKKGRYLGLKSGKYTGRYIADIGTRVGDLANELIRSGLARSYDGGKRQSWCS